jgi:hypothetical protein
MTGLINVMPPAVMSMCFYHAGRVQFRCEYKGGRLSVSVTTLARASGMPL